MTTYDEIPAGLELDAAVAVKVMGWTRLPDIIDGIVVCRMYRNPTGQEASYTPWFSRHIASAWDVVERMEELGYELNLSRMMGAYWDADFTVAEREPTEVGRGDTAPLAICRAALKAIGA